MARWLFWAVMLAYVVLGTAFVIRNPAWQAPDELAHYNYIRQVAEGTLIPVITLGDWDNDYLEQLKAERFHPSLLDRLDSVQYEDHQPPLYYWVSAPVYRLTNGHLTALRMVSLFWGVFTLLFTYRIGRLAFPKRPTIALGSMALVAFLPQHLMINASVNNDTLANALIAFTLWVCVRYVQNGDVHPMWMGLGLGAIVITKTTGYFMAGVVLLTILLYWRRARTLEVVAWRGRIEPLMIVAFMALPFTLFWWGRNLITYGGTDFLGLRAHDAVVIGQLRTADFIAQVGIWEYVRSLIEVTFNSFWGQFGWMGAPMKGIFFPNDNSIYTVIIALVVLSGVGLLVSRFHAPSRAIADESPDSRADWDDTRRVLLTVLMFALAQFVYYNSEFVQFQGRYLFSALIPFALFFVAGLDTFFYRIRLPYAGVVIVWGFAGLDAYLMWRVLPNVLSF